MLPPSSVSKTRSTKGRVASTAGRPKKTATKRSLSPFDDYSYDQLIALLQFADRFNARELTQIEAALARAADRAGYVSLDVIR